MVTHANTNPNAKTNTNTNMHPTLQGIAYVNQQTSYPQNAVGVTDSTLFAALTEAKTYT